ncbi:hypothetical protein ACTQ56_00630 [[Clostridium] aminophilum]|uniref:hypothetical protein n=1 Tax=[Clostridium] aminophilum TaxID=1526 RepID=UPI003F996CFF
MIDMEISKEELKTRMDMFYSKNYPDLIITNYIKDSLPDSLLRVLEKRPESEDLTKEEMHTAVDKLLSNEKVMDIVKNMIEDNQPNINKIPDDVLSEIREYFVKELPGYSPLAVYRRSNCLSDDYLYMVEAVSKNGTYAAWSCWNHKTGSLNYGHYGYGNREDAFEELKSHFYDITDEPEKYGIENTKVSLESEKESQSEGDQESKVIPLVHRKSR